MLEPVHGLAEPARGRHPGGRLGYDTLWTWDHLYPIVGDSHGPIFEGWLTITAWAQATERVRHRADGRRQHVPRAGLVAKMATTLDHISNGRAILGIGAAWFEEEHVAFGLPFGDGAAGAAALAGRGAADHARHARRDRADGHRPALHVEGDAQPPGADPGPPADLHRRRRREVTLKLVAKYADACNIGGGLETVRRKDAILREHCATVGRDEREIERTTGIGTVFIRDDRAEAERLFREAFERNRIAQAWADQPVGTPEDVAERLAPYVELGYRHLIVGVPGALRRGVDDPAHHRGQAAPGARRLTMDGLAAVSWGKAGSTCSGWATRGPCGTVPRWRRVVPGRAARRGTRLVAGGHGLGGRRDGGLRRLPGRRPVEPVLGRHELACLGVARR